MDFESTKHLNVDVESSKRTVSANLVATITALSAVIVAFVGKLAWLFDYSYEADALRQA